jgi:hypothetical protein
VFIFHGLRGGPVHMVTFEIATKLKAFLQDFAI